MNTQARDRTLEHTQERDRTLKDDKARKRPLEHAQVMIGLSNTLGRHVIGLLNTSRHALEFSNMPDYAQGLLNTLGHAIRGSKPLRQA